MLRGNFALFLALLLMSGTLSSGESEAGRGTGIEGVVTVSPIRPGPIKKRIRGSQRGAASKRGLFRREREGHGHIFYNRW